ncbi:MAG: YhfC family glutamic-type intramembrane protease [Bacillota bacterium]
MSDTVVYQVATAAYIAGYALGFLLFGLLWIRLFFPGSFSLRSRVAWPSVTLGALCMLLTLRIQVPIQSWINGKGASLGWSFWLVGSLLVLTSGVVQEALKAIGIAVVRVPVGWDVDWRSLGLGIGLGFGVWEAWQLVAWPLGLGRLWSPVAVLERFSAIGLHIGLAALIAYGFSNRRVLPFTALAAVLHAVCNFSVLLYQQWLIGFWAVEVYILVVSLATLFLAGKLWSRARQH